MFVFSCSHSCFLATFLRFGLHSVLSQTDLCNICIFCARQQTHTQQRRLSRELKKIPTRFMNRLHLHSSTWYNFTCLTFKQKVCKNKMIELLCVNEVLQQHKGSTDSPYHNFTVGQPWNKQTLKQRVLFLLVMSPLVTFRAACGLRVHPFRVTELELECPAGTDCPNNPLKFNWCRLLDRDLFVFSLNWLELNL